MKVKVSSHVQLTYYSAIWPGGGGVLPYIGYIDMCGPKGYGFSAVLVINRVSILADFCHFGQIGHGFCTLTLI